MIVFTTESETYTIPVEDVATVTKTGNLVAQSVQHCGGSFVSYVSRQSNVYEIELRPWHRSTLDAVGAVAGRYADFELVDGSDVHEQARVWVAPEYQEQWAETEVFDVVRVIAYEVGEYTGE